MDAGPAAEPTAFSFLRTPCRPIRPRRLNRTRIHPSSRHRQTPQNHKGPPALLRRLAATSDAARWRQATANRTRSRLSKARVAAETEVAVLEAEVDRVREEVRGSEGPAAAGQGASEDRVLAATSVLAAEANRQPMRT